MDIKAFVEEAGLGALVGVFTFEDLSRLQVGTIAALDDEFMVLNCVSRDGLPDGTTTYALENIHTIEYGSQYLRVIQYLRDHPLPPDAGVPAPVSPKRGDSLMLRELQLALQHREPVDLRVDTSEDDTSHTGIVRSVTDEWVSLTEFDNNGLDDGVTMIKVERITRVHRKDIDDLRLMRYWEWNSKMNPIE